MTSLYIWLKFLHLVGLGAFLLAHGVSAGASFVLRTQATAAARGPLLQLSVRSGAVGYPGLLLLIVTGVWMGFLGPWWRFGWIWAAIAVLVALMVAMSAMSVPYHGARDAVKANQDAEIESRLKAARPIALAVVGTVGLVLLIFLMVFKPF